MMNRLATNGQTVVSTDDPHHKLRVSNTDRIDEGLPPYTKAQRKCLSCGRMFVSEWTGNRLCPQCLRCRDPFVRPSRAKRCP